MKEKILYIDDSDELLELYSKALRDDFDIITLNDSRKALEITEREKPDLILLDYDMPEQNGIETFAKVKGFLGLKTPPVMFLSSFDLDHLVENAFQLGADDFIVKSTSIPQIKVRIKSKLKKLDPLQTPIVLSDEVHLNPIEHTINDKTHSLQLTPSEYKILYFASSNLKQLTKENLIAKVWSNTTVLEKTINTHLTNLRKKISKFNISIGIKKNGMVYLEKAKKK